MKINFLVKSKSVNLENYTIKDIPGSSGRLDVISRCILSALFYGKDLEDQVKIWVFLDNYGTYRFNSELLEADKIPKNELLLSNYFVDLIKKNHSNDKIEEIHPLASVKFLNKDIYKVIQQFLSNQRPIFVLNEKGAPIQKRIEEIRNNQEVVFIVGNQSGVFLEDTQFLNLNLPQISLGSHSFLASSVIKLIKMHLLKEM